jgi:hypothetical protein
LRVDTGAVDLMKKTPPERWHVAFADTPWQVKIVRRVPRALPAR